MIFFRIYQHLLPRARAWTLTVSKTLREFFQGISGIGPDAKTFVDDVWRDIFPTTTRELSAWEDQFALPQTGLTEKQRRDRLAATWKALGGQDPRYIQDTLQGAGFDVFIHEWWVPGSEPAPGVKQCVTPRSPLIHLRREFTNVTLFVECGEVLAECGEPTAEAGNGPDPAGYPLVNKVFVTAENDFTLCGEALAQCGEDTALCGNFDDFKQVVRNYVVPLDQAKWPYFLYIGGEIFGDLASVAAPRRDEFEALCLKICPVQQWLGILVKYT